MNYSQINHILRMTEFAPAQSKGLRNASDYAKYLESDNPVLRTLAQQLLGSTIGMKNALDVIAQGIASDPEVWRKSWEEEGVVCNLLQEVSKLPLEVGAGYMKLQGYLTKSINPANAMRYLSLVLVFSTRALFLGERRGFDSILYSCDARAQKYAVYLAEDYALALAGFHGLYSALLEGDLAQAVADFGERSLTAFAPEHRACAALSITFALLQSCGRGAAEAGLG